MITCWERADVLALLYVMFSCDFVSFPYGVTAKVWYLVVSIPDICLLSYFLSQKLLTIELSNNMVCAARKGSDQPAV